MRWRIWAVSLVLLAAAPALAQTQQSKVPVVVPGTLYSQARAAFLGVGDRPVVLNDPRRCAPGMSGVCRSYPETIQCSASGAAWCAFGWTTTAGRRFFVSTRGVNPAVERVQASPGA